MEYWNKDNFFLLTGTPGSEVFIGSAMGELVGEDEANHNNTKKCKPVRVLH